ncbi:MAG TPA: hypothetical protein VHY36_14135 [Steroidobacteraceae bacterium]|jgi:hypothetical protein|nr:hypothetical protein [Steroidobacteraceae bacterium]
MRQRALQALLLVHAIEQTDLAGDAVSLAFADGGRIDIFAYPLVGLLLWNLIVYGRL